MPCGWEGNRRSGVALAMRHRQQRYYHLRAHGLRKGDEHPAYTHVGVWHNLPYLYLYYLSRVFLKSTATTNNSNNRISIAPYGRNFKGAGGRSDQCSVKAWVNRKVLNSLDLNFKNTVADQTLFHNSLTYIASFNTTVPHLLQGQWSTLTIRWWGCGVKLL